MGAGDHRDKQQCWDLVLANVLPSGGGSCGKP